MKYSSFDLAAAMESLYETMDYYVSIPARTDQDLDTYWAHAIDPDGQHRNRLEERQSYLANIKEELAFINQLKPGKILDIGCGPGWLLSAIDPSWDRYGIEPATAAATIASKHAVIDAGCFEGLNLENKNFDLIVMYHVIEHMENPINVMHLVRRMLNPGGHLILGTPDFDSGAARRYGHNYRLLNDPTHISLFSNDSMHRLLRNSGFLIKSVSYPFFDTSYFNEKALLKLLAPNGVSPPFYGNFMTFYCTV